MQHKKNTNIADAQEFDDMPIVDDGLLSYVFAAFSEVIAVKNGRRVYPCTLCGEESYARRRVCFECGLDNN